MLIRTWWCDEIGVLDVWGRLGVESGAALCDAVSQALDAGRRRIVLNLTDMSAVDAAGLGELARAFTLVNEAGGTLKLVVRCATTRELLARTKLLGLFPTFPTEAEAIASFQPALSH